MNWNIRGLSPSNFKLPPLVYSQSRTLEDIR
jgi:hypothetical protein